MANIELRFNCNSGDGSYIKVFKPNDDYMCDMIDITITDEANRRKTIILDKSTAIKFAKTLRTEINKLEVYNG